MPSTSFTANPTISGRPVIYAASDQAGGSLSNASVDTGASVTFTTTTTNTKWLVEVEASVGTFVTSGSNPNFSLFAKVDGTGNSTGARYAVTSASNVGAVISTATMRGRVVVTLASAGSHTILAQVNNSVAVTGQYGVVTLTATQLT